MSVPQLIETEPVSTSALRRRSLQQGALQPVPSRPSRVLHLVDLENLLGGPNASPADIESVWRLFSRGIGVGVTDHVVVATSHHLARVAWFVLPRRQVQLRVRSGPNGADLALLDEFDARHAASRFEWLVIASGDGIFTKAALAARASGLRVHQVLGRGRSHHALRAACTRHTQLKLLPLMATVTEVAHKAQRGARESLELWEPHRAEEESDVRARRCRRQAVEAGAVLRRRVEVQTRTHRSRGQGWSDGRR